MKKIWIWLIPIAVIIVLIIIRPKNKDSAVATKAKSNAPVLVDARIIKPISINSQIKVTGTILSNEEVNLQSQIAGIVAHIYFKEGSHVKKGDMLIKIDDSQFQAEMQKDEVAKQLAQITEERQKKLLAINGISQQDYDVALNNLNSILADMKLLQVQIGYTEIRAPFNGVIGLRNVSEGSYVTTSTVLADLEELSPVKIDFYVPEQYLGEVQKNDSISFTVGGYSNIFKGTIYAIDPKIDEATRTLHIRALADNKSEKLLPGAFTNITIHISHQGSALMVPTEAIMPQINGQTVYLVKKETVVTKQVTLGIRTDSTVQLTTGVVAGDTIITRGVQLVHPGSKVNLKSIY